MQGLKGNPTRHRTESTDSQFTSGKSGVDVVSD